MYIYNMYSMIFHLVLACSMKHRIFRTIYHGLRISGAQLLWQGSETHASLRPMNQFVQIAGNI